MKKFSSVEEMLEWWGTMEREREKKLITPESQARLDAELAFHLRVIREKRWDLLEQRSRELCAKLGIPNRTTEEILAITDDQPTVSWNVVVREIVQHAQETFALLFRHPAFASVALGIFFVFAGSFFAVSKAKSALPGQSLYTVKLAFEEAKITLSWDEETKAKLEFARVKERAKEVQAVALDTKGSAAEKKERVSMAVGELKKGLSKVDARVKELEKSGAEEKLASVAKVAEEHGKAAVALLADTDVQLPKEVNGEFRKELRDALAGVNEERMYVLTFVQKPLQSEEKSNTIKTEEKQGDALGESPAFKDSAPQLIVSEKKISNIRKGALRPGISATFTPSVFSDPLSNPAPTVFTDNQDFGFSVFSDQNLAIE